MNFDYLGKASFASVNSVLATNVVRAGTGLVDTKGVFNSILPSLASGAAYPVNCYLVVVSGPVNESDFSTNYCSKKQDPNQSLQIDESALKLYFGSYAGLVDAFNYGGTVSFSLVSGEGRKFTLFGFNSTVSCAEAFTAFQNKSTLSKAYKLAESSTVDLLPGVPLTVDLNLPAEVDTNEAFSDCYIPNLALLYPEYTGAVVSKPGFPERTFRSFSTTQTTNFLCEPIDFKLRTQGGNYSVGTVLEDEYFTVEKGGSTIGTYDTAKECANDLTAANDGAAPFFKIAKNQTGAQRWIKRREGGISSVTYSLVKSDGVPAGSANFKQTFSPSTVFVDNIVPKKLVLNTCYEAVAVLRDFRGYTIQDGASFDITNTSGTLTGTILATDFFANAADCEAGNNPDPIISVAASQSFISYYFKAHNGTITAFDFQVEASGTTVTNSSPSLSVAASTSATAGEFSSLITYGRSGLPNNPAIDSGRGDCFPAFVSLVRSDSTEYVQDSSSTFTMQPLKVRVADLTGPNTNGYAIYSDSSCTVPVYPVGSTANASGTSIAAPGPSSSFYKIFIKPDNLNTFGARRLEFLYNGEGVGSYLFHLTDSNY